jgi:hypothetical protein
MAASGEWEDVKLYPNAAIFFQTDRMRSTYAEQILRRNEEEDEDEDEVKVKCLEMPSTPNDANVALEDFNDARLVQDGAEENIPIVVICPSRVFRKGTNLFTRFPPSTVIFVGNFSKSEIHQMQGRFGRFCQKFEEGDIVPKDDIKIVNIPLKFAESMVSKLTTLRDRSRSSPRHVRNADKLLSAYNNFCDIEPYDDAPDCRAAKVSADTLQTISELDVPTKPRNLGVDYLVKLVEFSNECDRFMSFSTFFSTITRISSNCTAEEWEEDDHCFEQGLATFAEQDVPEAGPSTSSHDGDIPVEDVANLAPLVASPL